MSRASKLTLAGTSLIAAGVVVFVHYAQQAEKAVSTILEEEDYPLLWLPAYRWQAMHAGVIRDIEQQKVKQERLADFEMQRAMEQEYRKVQSVHDGAEVVGLENKGA